MYKTILIALLLFSIAKVQGQDFGGWQSTDSLNVARQNGSSVELSNGNLLISGGITRLKSCEIYNYETEEWRLSDSLNTGQESHILVKLMNGNILSIGNYLANICEIFNVSTEKWNQTDSLNLRRVSPTVTLLNNGNVLVAGGYYFPHTGKAKDHRECEIYNPDSGKWTFTDSLTIGRWGSTATKLLDGKILFAGGNSMEQKEEVTYCDIYDPATGKWSEAAPLNVARYDHAAVLLNDGKVFVSGGANYSNPQNPWITSCEIYDPVENSWTVVNSLTLPRTNHSEVSLNNGLLLIVGGGLNNNTWEIYDPVNYESLYIGSYPGNQFYPNVNKLPNGKVLVAGGFSYNDAVIEPTKECFIYDPNLVDVKENNDGVPIGYELFQNYPNPFNPSTTIRYSLPKISDVKITIYDVLGNQLEIIFRGEQYPGIHTVKFHSSDLSSGIYFYSIETRNWEKTKKMLLIK